MNNYYENKIAVVTGAGSGIGRAIARLLASRGARVHCADIDLAAARAVATECGNARAHRVDVTDVAALVTLADAVYAADGRADLLFNNAGIAHGGTFADSEISDWRKLLDVNVMGVVHGIHAFLPRMQAQAGRSHIVNTASGAGLFATAGLGPYCASKHAVVGLSQVLAAELHGSNVAVTILCPGIVNTPILEKAQLRGEMLARKTRTQAFYASKGASPDKIAADLLADIGKGKLFCLTPRVEVGLGWMVQRLSPRLSQALMRFVMSKVLGCALLGAAILLTAWTPDTRADEPVAADAGPAQPAEPAEPSLQTIPVPGDAVEAKSVTQLDEVTVTAQKRKEGLQYVPVSVSTFSSDELAHISFHDVNDLVGYVPALTVDTNVSPLSTSFRIRNVGKFSAIPSFEPAVGLFIDGAYRARSGLGLGDLVDVARVEVLKGPQSTLYGKNVSAGVISVATQEPTKTFEAMSEVTFGTNELRQYKGYVSGPVFGGLSGRVSAISTRRGPFMQNLVGESHDDLGSQAIRGQLMFEPIDNLTSRLIVGYVDKNFHPKQGDVFVSDANIEIIRNAGGQVTNNNPRDGVVEYDDYNRFSLTATDFILNNVYTADRWSLTSISSYDEYKALSALRDAEQMSLSVAFYDDTQAGHTFSQELRLDTSVGERVSFLGGLYYLNSNFREGDAGRPEFVLQYQVEELGDSIAKYIAGNQGPTPGPPVPLIGVEGDRGDFLANLDTGAIGVFTKFDVNLGEDWGVSLGLRYSSEKKTGSLVQSLQLSPLGCVPPANASFICAVTPQDNNFNKSDTFSAVTGALQTTYQLTGDMMLYATASTGFKSGGYSLQNGTALPELRPYGSEDIINYEAGWKTEFLGRRARLNGAVFSTRYKNYQEASYKGLYFVVNSAESVSVRGLELDGKMLLTDRLTASLGLEYIKSIYDTYTGGQCFYGRPADNAQGQCDLSGRNLPIGAKLKTVTSLQWETDLYSGSFYTRLDYFYHGQNNSSSELDPRFDQPAYSLVNGSVGWRTYRVDVSLGGKNLTNEVIVDQSANANVLTPIDKAVSSPVGSYQNYIRSPLELALTVRVAF